MSSRIERLAERLGLIPDLHEDASPQGVASGSPLRKYPEPGQWDDFVQLDAQAWPRRVERHYTLVPTTCFNCEAACGLLAYVDRDTGRVRKFEGNPHHPGSRGRNCAKGPATINQINDPDRILYPLKRVGRRGEGGWERISWEQALQEIGSRIRHSLERERRDKIVYHVGRPGHEGYAERVLKAWGVDGHHSHTNICSAGARTGYALWQGSDRPSPDHANARVILLLSSHLETGHYFNPHAQRIIEGMMQGARLIVVDPRLSNTAAMADAWLPTQPGSEAALLLAVARILLVENLFDREFLRDWTNWRDYLRTQVPGSAGDFEAFVDHLVDQYREYTPEFAARETGLEADQIVQIAAWIGEAGSRFAGHVWRSASIGNLGGWQVARCLHFLSVLTGSVGTEGGTSPNSWNKFHPKLFDVPPAPPVWNELLFPPEYTLSHYEMSPILPHLIRDGRGSIDVYFTRVFNPVWTFPDGFSWIEMLTNRDAVGCHVALTPTWNETAFFADYVLPMGHASERHDLNSYETHSGTWIAFRQPVLRERARRQGLHVERTWEVNPGQVWEEDEFWIDLSWEIDREGDLGIRKHFESPYRKGEKIRVDEYYRYLFEHTPGLPERAAEHAMDPLEYMRRFGAFEVESKVYDKHERELTDGELSGSETHPDGRITKAGKTIGVTLAGRALEGFATRSGRQEFFSSVMPEFGYPEQAIPGYIRSHVHPRHVKRDDDEFVLLPTFRLPAHIHSRSANSKWLSEIAHRNPIWIHTLDARRLGLRTGRLAKIETEIGHFVDKVWVTESIKPGIVACSHHIGRWRREGDRGNRWLTNQVALTNPEPGIWKMRTVRGIGRFSSADPDSSRIFWRDGGVHQNLTHAVHPDPISGAHCWLQKVRVSIPSDTDRYGDVVVDTNKSFRIFKEWNEMARDRETHPGDLRRSRRLNRPMAPVDSAWYLRRS